MKSNAIEYLNDVWKSRYYANISKISQCLSMYNLLKKKKEMIKVISRDGFLIQVTDNRSKYYSKVRRENSSI